MNENIAKERIEVNNTSNGTNLCFNSQQEVLRPQIILIIVSILKLDANKQTCHVMSYYANLLMIRPTAMTAAVINAKSKKSLIP